MNLDKQIQELKQLREQLAKSNIKVSEMGDTLHRFTVVKPADAQAIQRAARQVEIAKREAREKRFSRPLTFKMKIQS
jgi:DNA-binding protein H-NS